MYIIKKSNNKSLMINVALNLYMLKYSVQVGWLILCLRKLLVKQKPDFEGYHKNQ